MNSQDRQILSMLSHESAKPDSGKLDSAKSDSSGRPLTIFFSVGEPSGDLHGSNLIKKLQSFHPNVKAVGYGGPKMREAGCDLHYDLTQLAVMWIVKVLLNIRTFWNLYQAAGKYFQQTKPDAVVLIDYPGFNWWIAAKAKKHGIPVYYYGAPQLWAWAPWRVKKMRRLVDHVLCKLPFEEDWFRSRGCNAHFVGHPYFDQLKAEKLDQAFVESMQDQPGQLVTILPGSRMQEVEFNLPDFLKTTKRLLRKDLGLRFAIASFNTKQFELARKLVAEQNLPVQVFVGRTPELISAADFCLACSGSVSLELLYHEKPTVISYRVSRFAYTMVRNLLIQVRFITLVNMLADTQPFNLSLGGYDPAAPDADKIPFPEYATYEDMTPQLASHIEAWSLWPRKLAAKQEQLRTLKQSVVQTGASETAAKYILRSLGVVPMTTVDTKPQPVAA